MKDEPDAEASLGLEPFGELVRRLRRARGLRQLDLASGAHIHDSYFSRIESGRHSLDAQDLERIKMALPRLTSDEEADLERAFARSLLDQHGLTSEVVLEVDEILATVSGGAAIARQLRLTGRPHEAVSAAQSFTSLARTSAQQARAEGARAILLSSLAEVLAEQVKGYLDFVVAEEVRSNVTPLIAEQYAIARVLEDERVERLAAIGSEGALYVAGAHRDANLLCRDLLDDLSQLDSPWAQEVARAAAINSGLLGDDDELRRASASIEMLVADLDHDEMTAVFLLEGLARGQAKLLGPTAVETLEEAWEHLEAGRVQGDFSNLRFVQLVRTHLETLSTLRAKFPDSLIRSAETAVQICTQAEYGRHGRQLSRLLEDL
jgi:transcriptional regulator with XRE-family HTH domain